MSLEFALPIPRQELDLRIIGDFIKDVFLTISNRVSKGTRLSKGLNKKIEPTEFRDDGSDDDEIYIPTRGDIVDSRKSAAKTDKQEYHRVAPARR